MGDHYLPQMLLKHFCDSDGLLWVARKGQDQPFQTTPRNVFAVNNLYTKHTPLQIPTELDGPFNGTDRQSISWLRLRVPLPTRFVRSSGVPENDDFPSSGQTHKTPCSDFSSQLRAARRNPRSASVHLTPKPGTSFTSGYLVKQRAKV